jgi:phage tail sheath protein FI
MQAMEGVSTSTAGFVGMAEKGPVVGTPVFLTSFADYKRTFGGYLAETSHGDNRFLPYAVEQFFANGGARCYVMRVAPGDAKAAAAVLNAVQFTAANPGKWGNEIKVAVEAASSLKSQVLGVEETIAGDIVYTLKNPAGLRVGDTVAVLEKGELGEYNRVASINGDKVTFENLFEKDITDKGLVPKKVLVSAEVNILVTCGDDAEQFEYVSFNPASPADIANRLAKSALINATYKTIDGIFPPMLAFTGEVVAPAASVYLTGGADGNCAGASDDVFIGGGIAPGKRTGLEAFVEISNVSIMAIPGITSPAVQLALVAQCQNLANRFAVLDMPGALSKPQDLLAHREIVDSDYAAMYHPWLTIFDGLARKQANIPPSGSIAGIYARSDNTRGVHKAPANEVVNNCIGLSSLYNKGEQDLLNPAGVNLIRALPGQGIRVWGGRTCSSNGLWKYVNVRRLFIFLEETIRTQTNWAVFEPNDSVLWMRVKVTISAFLRDMYRSGALVGATEAEAFFVNVGYETMTQQDILNGRMICEIGVAPSRPAEFIIFRITQNTRAE